MLRSIHVLTQGCAAEEFSIYLNYIRKLGFEETSNYDFLRELFAKVLKNNSDLKTVFMTGTCWTVRGLAGSNIPALELTPSSFLD